MQTTLDPDKLVERAAKQAVEAASYPDNPDALLRRRRLAEALTACGFQITEKTLATMATRGGGPPYHLWGRFPLYRWASALAWAESRLSAPRLSTSEADAKQNAV
jgi:hypothetical protein